MGVGAVRRRIKVQQVAVGGAGALLEFGEQSAPDSLRPGSVAHDKIIDGQFAAAESCRHDPPAGDAKAGVLT